MFHKPDKMAANNTLEEMNSTKADQMLPVIVVLGVLMFLGLIGNIMVCFYYGHRTRRTTNSIFIVALAVFDLMMCLLSIPIEIVDLRLFYMFRNGGACKVLRFINHFAATGSAVTLLVISVDRFRRICRPFKTQMNLRQAKIACIVAAAVSIFVSWPSVFLYDAVEVDVRNDIGVVWQGSDCTTIRDKGFKVYLWIFNGFYFLVFVSSTVMLCTMYSLIGKTVSKQKKTRFKYAMSMARNDISEPESITKSVEMSDIGSKTNNNITNDLNGDKNTTENLNGDKNTTENLKDDKNTTENLNGDKNTTENLNGDKYTTENLNGDNKTENNKTELSNDASDSGCDSTEPSKDDGDILASGAHFHNNIRDSSHNTTADIKEDHGSCQMRSDRQSTVLRNTIQLNVKAMRYTMIMLVITVVYVISFLPYLILVIWRMFVHGYEVDIFSDSGLVAFQFGIRSYFLNSALNPLIYGFFNPRFRSFFYSSFCPCCARKSEESSQTSTSGET